MMMHSVLMSSVHNGLVMMMITVMMMVRGRSGHSHRSSTGTHRIMTQTEGSSHTSGVLVMMSWMVMMWMMSVIRTQ